MYYFTNWLHLVLIKKEIIMFFNNGMIINTIHTSPSNLEDWRHLILYSFLHVWGKKIRYTKVFVTVINLIDKVNIYYLGLDSHPQHELVQRTWTGCSGMCSFYIKGGLMETKIFLKSLKVFTVAASLGGCESLAGLP